MKRKYIYIEDLDDVEFESETGFISVDLETTGLNFGSDKILGISFCLEEGIGYYTDDLDILKEVLESDKWTKIFHNAPFDLTFLKMAEYEVNGMVHDTLSMATVLDPDSKNGLKSLSYAFFGEQSVEGDKELGSWLREHKLTKADMEKAPRNVLTKYAAEDAINTFELFYELRGELERCQDKLEKMGFKSTPVDVYFEEMLPIIPVVVSMQTHGIEVDLNKTLKVQSELLEEIQSIEKRLTKEKSIKKVEKIIFKREREKKRKQSIKSRIERREAKLLKDDLTDEQMEKTKQEIKDLEDGKVEINLEPAIKKFNWNSTDHLSILMYEVLEVKVNRRTDKGNPSTDAETLKEIDKEYGFDWLKDLLKYRSLAKLEKTYIKGGILDTHHKGIVRAHFNPNGTVTGRFSSSDPNLQNLPRSSPVKSLFIAREGKKFVYADYSQLELRIAAHLSNDKLMVKEYNKDNPDLHSQTAAYIYNKEFENVQEEERAQAKNINFAIIYNAGGYRIAEMLEYFEGLDFNLYRSARDKRKYDEELTKEEKSEYNKFRKAVKRGDDVRNNLLKNYTGLNYFIKQNISKLKQQEMSVTEFGRVRLLSNINSDDWKKSNNDMKEGFNMLIQSFGASITRRAMIELYDMGFQLVSQIHDAIVVEVSEENLEDALEAVQGVMENIIKLRVPLIAEPKILESLEEKE